MTSERPDDIKLTEITVDEREVGLHEIDHGNVTVDDQEVYHAEAAAELEILEDGRQRVTFLLGDAELSIVYNRETQDSAERAAVLLLGAPNMLNQVEDAYDAAD